MIMKGSEILMKFINAEPMIGEHNGSPYNFDRYNFESINVLGNYEHEGTNHHLVSSKEYSMVVDYLDGTVTGDKIAHGSWGDTVPEENLEMLLHIKKNNLELRDITKHIDNTQKEVKLINSQFKENTINEKKSNKNLDELSR